MRAHAGADISARSWTPHSAATRARPPTSRAVACARGQGGLSARAYSAALLLPPARQCRPCWRSWLPIIGGVDRRGPARVQRAGLPHLLGAGDRCRLLRRPEHIGGEEGALRGFTGGLLFGTFILVAHELSGSDPKADLPEPEMLLVVLTTVLGVGLGALGGRSRAKREAARRDCELVRPPPRRAPRPHARSRSGRSRSSPSRVGGPPSARRRPGRPGPRGRATGRSPPRRGRRSRRAACARRASGRVRRVARGAPPARLGLVFVPTLIAVCGRVTSALVRRALLVVGRLQLGLQRRGHQRLVLRTEVGLVLVDARAEDVALAGGGLARARARARA